MRGAAASLGPGPPRAEPRREPRPEGCGALRAVRELRGFGTRPALSGAPRRRAVLARLCPPVLPWPGREPRSARGCERGAVRDAEPCCGAGASAESCSPALREALGMECRRDAGFAGF